MSTEFEIDGDGFSAVSSFFGGREDDDKFDKVDEKKKKAEYRPAESKLTKAKQRLGVGAKQSQSGGMESHKNDTESDAKKKIMSIGKKRKLGHDNDDDDDDDETTSSSHDDDSDDDEENEGRTAIKARTKKRPAIPAVEIPKKAAAKKKKKKGKKERMAEKQQSQLELNSERKDQSHDGTDANNVNHTNNEKNDHDHDIETMIEDPTTMNTNKKKKRKKPKARSRQKNIKKDTRPSSLKPSHLKLGTHDYKGRPMTKETRAFLNLPIESRTERIRKQKLKFGNSSGNGNGIIGGGGDDEYGDKYGDGGGGLAIDDLLKIDNDPSIADHANANVDINEDISEVGQLVNNNGVNHGAITKKKAKKDKHKDKKRAVVKEKKKTKYKNLK